VGSLGRRSESYVAGRNQRESTDIEQHRYEAYPSRAEMPSCGFVVEFKTHREPNDLSQSLSGGSMGLWSFRKYLASLER